MGWSVRRAALRVDPGGGWFGAMQKISRRAKEEKKSTSLGGSGPLVCPARLMHGWLAETRLARMFPVLLHGITRKATARLEESGC
jgi:hypothetical protein